ncbi:MAG: C15orf41 family protein [Methanosarcinaceae archaeon]|nr:C15orf41 family protein [Methanosarcinaceae archaeon]MDF1533539.1 C15orf41 family protein [Methanosarcinaceae archaeon]
MDIDTYLKIRDSLNSSEDVEHVSEDIAQPVGVITAILSQKIVSNVKKTHGRIKSKSKWLLLEWDRGDTILNIANRNNIPATLMASIILKEMGHSKKYINEMFNDPNNIQEKRLKDEIVQALNSDYFFSPQAHQIQTEKGKMGESVIEKWLNDNNIEYRNENDLRDSGATKTPDCVLNEPLNIDGTEVSWIESKALFGDEAEHKHYSKKQFKHYEEEYGQGMVVYWYGYLDSLTLDGHLIKNYEFFDENSDDVQTLLDLGCCW